MTTVEERDEVGDGCVVAVVDSGLNPACLADSTLVSGINVSGIGTVTDTSDAVGHGTAVAATITTMAPHVRLVPVKVTDARGAVGDPQALERAFTWLLAQRGALQLDLVCLAMADSTHRTSDADIRDSPLQRHIAALRGVGVLTMAAAGNWYPEYRRRQPQGMAWPAILREVVSVGALRVGPAGVQLAPTTQRLHVSVGTGCHTTVFAMPGALDDTSGAAAVITGYLAALQQRTVSSAVLVQRLLDTCQAVTDASGLAWPALPVTVGQSGTTTAQP